MGGRMDYLNGHPVAAVVFRRSQHIINVFVWPVTTNSRGLHSMTHQGYHMIEMIQEAMEYWVLSDRVKGACVSFTIKTTNAQGAPRVPATRKKF